MTDQDLERRLRAWYQAQIPEMIAAPAELRSSLAAIARAQPMILGLRRPDRRRAFVLLAAALAIASIGVTVAVGSGLFRKTSVLPAPSIGPSSNVSVTPAPSVLVSSPSPSILLGGSPILAEEITGDGREPHLLEFVDPATGTTTSLGTLARTSGWPYRLQWTADRSRVLVSGLDKQHGLDVPTAAASGLDFVCCHVVTGASEQVLSPDGSRLAAILWVRKGNLANDHVGEIVVIDVTSGRARHLPAPAGVLGLAALTWSPDGSTLAAAGCRPCDTARSPSDRHTPERSHLYLVPVDGSPWRELRDATDSWATFPAWSPDGSTIAVAVQCASPQVPSPCPDPAEDLGDLVLMDPADGAESAAGSLAAIAGGPAWSPDGQRLAFVGADGRGSVQNRDGTGRIQLLNGPLIGPDGIAPVWSPDGEWILFKRQSDGHLWIVPSDGGDGRDLGIFGGVAW
jgi:WD40 repeat protein